MTQPGSVFSDWMSAIPKFDLDRRGKQGRLATMFVTLPDQSLNEWLERVPKEGLVYARAMNSAYFRFCLESVSTTRAEKYQLQELAGDQHHAIFYGASPMMLQAQGYLYNTVHDEWWDAFSYIYEYLLRGTRGATAGNLVNLELDTREFSGAILSLSDSITTQTESRPSFSFQMLVRSSKFNNAQSVISQVEQSAEQTRKEAQEKIDEILNAAATKPSTTTTIIEITGFSPSAQSLAATTKPDNANSSRAFVADPTAVSAQNQGSSQAAAQVALTLGANGTRSLKKLNPTVARNIQETYDNYAAHNKFVPSEARTIQGAAAVTPTQNYLRNVDRNDLGEVASIVDAPAQSNFVQLPADQRTNEQRFLETPLIPRFPTPEI